MDASGIARGIVLYTLPAIGLVGGLIGCGLNAFYLNEYLAIAPSLWTMWNCFEMIKLVRTIRKDQPQDHYSLHDLQRKKDSNLRKWFGFFVAYILCYWCFPYTSWWPSSMDEIPRVEEGVCKHVSFAKLLWQYILFLSGGILHGYLKFAHIYLETNLKLGENLSP